MWLPGDLAVGVLAALILAAGAAIGGSTLVVGGSVVISMSSASLAWLVSCLSRYIVHPFPVGGKAS